MISPLPVAASNPKNIISNILEDLVMHKFFYRCSYCTGSLEDYVTFSLELVSKRIFSRN